MGIWALKIWMVLLLLGISGLMILSNSSKVYGHGTIDQSFTGPYIQGLGLFDPAGQTFTPTASNLVGVDIFLHTGSPPITRDVTVSIWPNTDFVPGTELGTVTKELTIPQVGFNLSEEFHFDFVPQIPLTPGEIFVIRIDTGVQTIGSPFSNANLYPDGGAFQLGPPVSQFSDIGFRTYFIESVPVGGEMINVDSSVLILAGTQTTASWMIPAIVSAIGIGIVIARKF